MKNEFKDLFFAWMKENHPEFEFTRGLRELVDFRFENPALFVDPQWEAGTRLMTLITEFAKDYIDRAALAALAVPDFPLIPPDLLEEDNKTITERNP